MAKRIYSHGDAVTRALRHVVYTSECWEWAGAKSTAGYAHMNLGDDKYGPAHRVLYVHFRGPIVHELDHLCRNRGCVNPWHLEDVTHAENVRRGASPMMVARRAGTCTKGHPATAEHVYFRKGTKRIVYCKSCRKERRACQV
jgi:HNH endonuclease